MNTNKYLFLITIVVLGHFVGATQTIVVQTYVQQTIMGLQKGCGLRFQTKKGLGIGTVYQANTIGKTEKNEFTYSFYGLEFIVPLTKYQKVRFFFTPKIGFANKQFFVIIPEMETRIWLKKWISVGVTTGIRARESAVGLKTLFQF